MFNDLIIKIRVLNVMAVLFIGQIPVFYAFMLNNKYAYLGVQLIDPKYLMFYGLVFSLLCYPLIGQANNKGVNK